MNFFYKYTLKYKVLLNKYIMENETVKTEKWYQSITVKMILLAGMGLMLLIPLFLIQNVIREREGYANDARAEIGRLWASSQTITGPVLNVPGMKVINDKGEYETTTMHIMPENLKVNGNVKPEVRYRGIYESVVYDSDIELTGSFNTTGFENLNDYTYDWSKAYITLGVSDNKGLRGDVRLVMGNRTTEAEPGAVQHDVFEKGITFLQPVLSSNPADFKGNFSIKLGLKGSETLSFSPVGKTTEVNLSSPWSSPSFQGTFLPTSRDVSANGFKATWLVTHLNRNFPQAWTGASYHPENDSFGVNLMLQVDHYTKTERSAKYGILFILFTFFVLLIVELRSSERIHLFYYLLVAFALILFFSLLSALSEHVGFNAAYLISSVAIIGLLSAFFRSLTKKWWVVLLISGLLSTLYLFIFVLLALKDYAYLGGNIGLFIILAVLMMVSSKFRLFSDKKDKDGFLSI